MKPVRTALYVFLFFGSLYFLSNSGDFLISDGEVMFQTTVRLASGKGLALAPDPGLPQIVPGRDGLYFSKYGLGTPMAAVPLYLAGRALAKLLPGADPMGLGHFMVAQLNVLASTASVTLVFLTGSLLFSTRGRALLVALIYGLGTSVWPYSGVFFSEPLLGLCLLTAFYAALRYRLEGHPRWLLVAGAALGYSVLVKVSAVVLLPLFFGYLAMAWKAKAHEKLWDPVLLSVPMAAAACLVLWHNYLRFGNPLDNGYAGESFSTPLLVGLYGLLFSSGKSVFVYSPPLVLAPWGLGKLLRKVGPEALLAIALAIVTLLYYSGWWAWYGGWCWGPRFLVPAVPFAVLGLGALPWGNLWVKACGALLLILGAGVQLLGVLVDFNFYISSVVQGDPNRDWLYIFYPWMSPLAAHWNHLLSGGATLPRIGRYYEVGLPEPLSTFATATALVGLAIAAALLVSHGYTLAKLGGKGWSRSAAKPS
jgi:4-amino-4-deoxy-L-arabinose transferase-like glycosyltransferase